MKKTLTIQFIILTLALMTGCQKNEISEQDTVQ